MHAESRDAERREEPQGLPVTGDALRHAHMAGNKLLPPEVEAPASSKVVLLIRHGQAEHNPPDHFSLYWIWHAVMTRDSALTPAGIEQCRGTGESLRARGVTSALEAVFVSPMSRAIHTAHLLFCEARASRGAGALAMTLEPQLTERRSASDTGSAAPELLRRHPYIARAPWRGVDALNSHWWPPDYEGEPEVEARVQRLCRMLLARPERVVCCVGHGAFFKTLLRGEYLPNATPRWGELRADGSFELRPAWDALSSWARDAEGVEEGG